MNSKEYREMQRIVAERDYYKSVADTLQATLEETEDAFRAAKGQIAQMLRESRFPDLKVG